MNQMFFGNSKIMFFDAGSSPAPEPVEPTPPNGKVLFKTSASQADWSEEDANIVDGAFNGFVGKESAVAVVIPNKDSNGNDVMSIGEGAFAECTSLKSVMIPNSVTSIEVWAFYGCSGLMSMTIPESVMSIGGWAFNDCSGLMSVTIPDSVTSIGSSAFSGCSGLESMTIPNRVTSIQDHTFEYCSSLTSVTIPDSVTSIQAYAFDHCSGLTNVTIPASVTSIEEYAFINCSSLTSIVVLGKTCEQVQQMYSFSQDIPNTCIIECSDGKLIYVDDEWTNFEDHKVYYTTTENSNWQSDDADISNGEFNGFNENNSAVAVIIPSKDGSGHDVTSIQPHAFGNCSNLTSVIIPNSVTNIYNESFDGSGLTSVTIPNSVTSIGGEAFARCTHLTSVTIPDSVTHIGDYVFDGCSELTSVTIVATGKPEASAEDVKSMLINNASVDENIIQIMPS